VPTFGLLPEGFVPATITVIREELEEETRAEFGRSLPLADSTLFGYFIGIISERLGLLWEVEEAIYSSGDPDKATGAALRALCLLTATFPIDASSSTVIETLCGDDGTVVAAGFIVSTASTGRKFDSLVDVVLVQLDDWTAGASYSVGDRVNNSSRCYVCITAGVADASGGPTTTDDDIVDNSVHWRYLGEGEAAIDVMCASEDTGAIVALAGDLTNIETPLGGVNSARNVTIPTVHDGDAVLGRDASSDEELRLLREAELAQPGTGTPDAIRAALLEITGVTNATVFYNNTDTTDVDGLPPHSTEVLVQGGADQDIWDALWDNVPVGIATVGTEVGNVVDDEGVDQTMRFSRPEVIDIYIRMALIENPKTYDGDATVKTAITTWGDARETGDDAVASAIGAQAFRVTGVNDVTEVLVYNDVIGVATPWADATPYNATPGARDVVENDGGRKYICITTGVSSGSGPTGTDTDITDGTVHWRYLGATIPISLRQLADYDSARIALSTTEGVP
jgi:hypothetical protein